MKVGYVAIRRYYGRRNGMSKYLKSTKSFRVTNPRTTTTTTNTVINNAQTRFRTLILNAPEVVRDKIFARLPYPSQLQVRRVCKSWLRLVDEIIPFHIQLNKITFKTVLKFPKERNVGKLTVDYFPQPFPDEGLGFSPEELVIKKPRNYSEALTGETIAKMINEFGKGLRGLSLDSGALINSDGWMWGEVRLEELRSLELSVEIFGVEAISTLLSRYFPFLRHLKITIWDDNDLFLYGEIYYFLTRHYRTLETVETKVHSKFNTRGLRDHNETEEEESSTVTAQGGITGQGKKEEIMQNLTLVKLKTLEMHVTKCEGSKKCKGSIRNLCFQLHFLQLQPEKPPLSKLTLTNLRHSNLEVWKTLPPILSQCAPTLTSLTLDGCFCDQMRGTINKRDRADPFDCNWIEGCNKLRVLEFLVCGLKVIEIEKIPRKNLRVLCLGHLLTHKQMVLTCDLFRNIEELSWPQLNSKFYFPVVGRSPSQGSNRVVTVNLFRRALGNLQKLKKLNLFMDSCSIVNIRISAGRMIGVYENRVNNSKKGDLEFSVDRKLFLMPRPKKPGARSRRLLNNLQADLDHGVANPEAYRFTGGIVRY